MSGQKRAVVTCILAVSALVALVEVFLPTPVAAEILRRVNLPESVDCLSGASNGGGHRTSVAAVQGSKLGFPEKPVVLVTSCFVETVEPNVTAAAQKDKLYVLDPGTPDEGFSDAVLLKTITTSVAPQNGWGSLAYRTDQGDLIGCASRIGLGHQVYRIAFTATGLTATATQIAGISVLGTAACTGIAWDPNNDTIYVSSDGEGTIFHYSATGTAFATPSFPAPPNGVESTCDNTGLAVAGGTLFVNCGDDGNISQVDKTVGHTGLNRSIDEGASTKYADLECDPVTFASEHRDALWTANALGGSNRLYAVGIPAGTCGLPANSTVQYPGACLVNFEGTIVQDPDNTADADGDGLLDCWEDGAFWASNPPCPGCALDGLPGIDFDGDGIRDVVLCVETNGTAGFQAVECANPSIKDLFVEFDAMVNHGPNTNALNQIVTAFFNAPVNSPGGPGIRLHIQVDDLTVPHTDNTRMTGCTPSVTPFVDFDVLKGQWWGTIAQRPAANDSAATLAQKEKARNAKRLAFRYGLGVHNLARNAGTTSPSGCAEVQGNDFIVALGSFPTGTTTAHKNGTEDQYAGTWMHEFGHTLGLRHGGGDNNNCKPNHLSIMSYSRQFKNVISDRPLDYSRVLLPTLIEGQLSEVNGIGLVQVPAGAKTTFGTTATGLTIASTAKIAAGHRGDQLGWRHQRGREREHQHQLHRQRDRLRRVGHRAEGVQRLGEPRVQHPVFVRAWRWCSLGGAGWSDTGNGPKRSTRPCSRPPTPMATVSGTP